MTDAELNDIIEDLIADGLITKRWNDREGDWEYKLTEAGLREANLAILFPGQAERGSA